MYAFNNYCAACDKLIANVSKSTQLSRSSSNVSDKTVTGASDRLYCSHECERKDKLHIVDSTVTASENVNDDEEDDDLAIMAPPGMECDSTVEPVVSDSIAGLASPASICPMDKTGSTEEVPSITITTVTDDITSKAVLDERELLLASPLLLPSNSNSSNMSKLDINYEHRGEDDDINPHYYSIPPISTIYNIPKDLFLGCESRMEFENRSFDHTAENFYKLWLSNNSP